MAEKNKKTVVLNLVKLEYLLKDIELSQTDLANIIEVDPNTLRRWLNGSIKRVKELML